MVRLKNDEVSGLQCCTDSQVPAVPGTRRCSRPSTAGISHRFSRQPNVRHPTTLGLSSQTPERLPNPRRSGPLLLGSASRCPSRLVRDAGDCHSEATPQAPAVSLPSVCQNGWFNATSQQRDELVGRQRVDPDKATGTARGHQRQPTLPPLACMLWFGPLFMGDRYATQPSMRHRQQCAPERCPRTSRPTRC